MKLFILGATGASGITLVEQAMKAGHQVTVYVRNPEKLLDIKNKIKIIQGELGNEKKLLESMAGHDAVLSTLGYRKFRDKSNFISRAIVTVLKGMEKHRIPKLVYESAYGIGGNESVKNPYLRFFLNIFGLINPFKDHFKSEYIINRSKVDFTIAHPGRLTNGELTGIYRAEEGLKGMIMISRADVAHFMLDALTNKKWSRKTIDLGY